MPTPPEPRVDPATRADDVDLPMAATVLLGAAAVLAVAATLLVAWQFPAWVATPGDVAQVTLLASVTGWLLLQQRVRRRVRRAMGAPDRRRHRPGRTPALS